MLLVYKLNITCETKDMDITKSNKQLEAGPNKKTIGRIIKIRVSTFTILVYALI